MPEPFAGPPPVIDRLWLHRLSGGPRPERIAERLSIPQLTTSLFTLPPWALDNLRGNLADVEGSLIDYYTRWLGGR